MTDKEASLEVSFKYYDFEPVKSEQFPGKVYRVKCKHCGKVYAWNQTKRQREHLKSHGLSDLGRD